MRASRCNPMMARGSLLQGSTGSEVSGIRDWEPTPRLKKERLVTVAPRDDIILEELLGKLKHLSDTGSHHPPATSSTFHPPETLATAASTCYPPPASFDTAASIAITQDQDDDDAVIFRTGTSAGEKYHPSLSVTPQPSPKYRLRQPSTTGSLILWRTTLGNKIGTDHGLLWKIQRWCPDDVLRWEETPIQHSPSLD